MPSLPTASLPGKREGKLQKHLSVYTSLSSGWDRVPCGGWHHTWHEGVGQARGASRGATAAHL